MVPSDYDSARVQRLLRKQPSYSQIESEIGAEPFMLCVMRGGDAIASVACAEGKLIVSSIWVGSPPNAVVLTESLRLQADLIRIIRTVDPRIPVECEWSVEWVNMEAQPGHAAAGPQAARG